MGALIVLLVVLTLAACWEGVEVLFDLLKEGDDQ